jgi:hypothetical protein
MKNKANCACQCCDHGWDTKTPYIQKAVEFALSLPKQRILWIAPSMSKARKSLIHAKELAGLAAKTNLTRSEILFNNGSKIWFASHHNPDKLRGLKLDTAFIEETISQEAQEIIKLLLY